MSMLPSTLVASVAACLLGVTAAAAQGSPSPSQASPNSGTGAPEQAPPATLVPADSELPENSTAPGAATVNATVTVDANGNRHILIASPPVPDTAENRAKYGSPLSNAGRRTQPAGN